ncbi:CYTH domain-containing protein [Cyanobacterium stanieri LEGE 03274]|uniref:CYTH domain-containing protein n=1 Tax=Cyanobacterium stanieri LEGE 03274 TaxID=1828756 RepID=A0ABR9UZK8_9CHRO|nr:CYTH domain-containing protein [Cyanobacterium stanieri]MBE9221073.1 CYTH domain-containing protein [Cyanobacterium stanieri LEGE 03274]
MSIEIERKFLVNKELWQPPDEGVIYQQGYIYTQNGSTVRVRVAGNVGFLTLKTKTNGMSRYEFEYPIPLFEAQEMLRIMCDRPLIEKKRYKIKIEELIWEIDEFFGDNQGLLLAEVELSSENQTISLPPWIDREVTGDLRYYNSNLVKNPYNNGKWIKS